MQTKNHTIYLFDVDGTLMTFHDAGRKAYRYALRELVGPPEELLDFSFAGLTDRGLVRKALERAGESPDAGRIEAVLELYADALPDVLGGAEFTTHPGVHETVSQLHELDDVAIGLGTGNIERGARLKLSRAEPELNRFFDFGGFGSDAELRHELLTTGARRGAKRLGVSVSDCRIFVIGDTPKDVRAAREIGATAIAVTSGGATRDELTASEPDHIFKHLGDDGLLAALTR